MDSGLLLDLILWDVRLKTFRNKFIAAVNIVMINKICERYHRCGRQSPTKASCYYIYESLIVKLIHFLRFIWIVNLGKQRLVLRQCLLNQTPFFVIILFISLNCCFQYCILKFGKFIVRPIHRQICLADNFEIRVEKRCLSFEKLIKNIDDEFQINCIVVLFENFGVFSVYLSNFWRSNLDCMFVYL